MTDSEGSPEGPKGAPAAHTLPIPWIKLRSAGSGPTVFKRMIGEADSRARPGDIVAVYDKSGAPYGVALYNPRSLIALRLLTRGVGDFEAEAFFQQRIDAAVRFRHEDLKLNERSDAYRLVHDLGDGLPGVVIDRLGEFVVIEYYTLAMFKQAARLERALRKHFPQAKFIGRANEYTQKMEGFELRQLAPMKGRVQENGVLFEVTPTAGYKTGFFCDQRENRLAASEFARGRSVLDVCSYTGGFGIYAAKKGGAKDVTALELDPEAAALCQRNANINQVKVDVVCVDAFVYLRQKAQAEARYGLVVLDPYKLISSRENYDFGRKKYIDFNRLALSIVEPGGFLVTNSCSGLVQWTDFQQFVRTAAGSAGRRVQMFRKSGAGADHPVSVDYPENEYLKTLWCRVF
jgi:23S rRNA (cytosine1962-C5)-methyltransferase